MSKGLITLAAIQTAALLFIIAMLMNDNATQRTAVPVADTVDDVSRVPAVSENLPLVNEQQLRRIVREELERIVAEQGAFDAVGPEGGDRPVRNPEEDRYMREFVSSQIDYYKSLGDISPQQMMQLQREIARLDDAGRREMLSKLVRAMNAREIEGRF